MNELDKTYILHLIDHATRYSADAAVKNKKKEDVAEAIIKYWIGIFGAPRVILSDNGDKFNNELLREVCEQFNITMKSTVAGAPWSNGIVDWQNAVLKKIIKKLKLDNSNTYPIDVIVCWAISAKNELQSYGFSPNQLVFGKSTCHQI